MVGKAIMFFFVVLAAFEELERDNVQGGADSGMAGAGTQCVQGTRGRHNFGEGRAPRQGRHGNIICMKGVGASTG